MPEFFKDDMEVTAEYYAERVGVELKNLLDVLTTLVAEKNLTYAQFLQIKQKFEHVDRALHARDLCGSHSRTGHSKFRHMAHPDKYPAPADPEPALV